MSINPALNELHLLQEAFGLSDVNLTILRPYQMYCPLIADKKVILFAYDSEAMHWLANDTCKQQQQSNYEVLSTKIMFY
jgi:hypothetical protein